MIQHAWRLIPATSTCRSTEAAAVCMHAHSGSALLHKVHQNYNQFLWHSLWLNSYEGTRSSTYVKRPEQLLSVYMYNSN
jgi:hypothetical protein